MVKKGLFIKAHLCLGLLSMLLFLSSCSSSPPKLPKPSKLTPAPIASYDPIYTVVNENEEQTPQNGDATPVSIPRTAPQNVSSRADGPMTDVSTQSASAQDFQSETLPGSSSTSTPNEYDEAEITELPSPEKAHDFESGPSPDSSSKTLADELKEAEITELPSPVKAHDFESGSSPDSSSETLVDELKEAEITSLPPPPVPDAETVAPIPAAFFCYNKSDIWNPKHHSLVALGRCYASENVRELIVIGHADSRGGEEYNKDLSKQRADAVADYLKREWSKVNRSPNDGAERQNRACEYQPKIEENEENLRGGLNIEIQACGESQPKKNEDSERAHAYNRRVEVVAVANRAIITRIGNLHLNKIEHENGRRKPVGYIPLTEINKVATKSNQDTPSEEHSQRPPPPTTPSFGLGNVRKGGDSFRFDKLPILKPQMPDIESTTPKPQKPDIKSGTELSGNSFKLGNKGLAAVLNLTAECATDLREKIKQRGHNNSFFETKDRLCQPQ